MHSISVSRSMSCVRTRQLHHQDLMRFITGPLNLFYSVDARLSMVQDAVNLIYLVRGSRADLFLISAHSDRCSSDDQRSLQGRPGHASARGTVGGRSFMRGNTAGELAGSIKFSHRPIRILGTDFIGGTGRNWLIFKNRPPRYSLKSSDYFLKAVGNTRPRAYRDLRMDTRIQTIVSSAYIGLSFTCMHDHHIVALIGQLCMSGNSAAYVPLVTRADCCKRAHMLKWRHLLTADLPNSHTKY
jgi:hypothetical protein